ncbi:hypothetical protein, partial [Anaerolinea sp.]|uniref:hypothetical protein n=1 Tax=Anaerolinea sp. TaxID=1872519 RepID=UPI002ACDE77A
ALYDSQGNVRVKAQVIAVDVASGEWLSRSDVETGFAYLDAGQVRTFRWQAEGEMPFFGNPRVSFQDGILISEDLVPSEFVICKNHECVHTHGQGKFLGRDHRIYTLSRSEITKLWSVTDEDEQVLASFSVPENSSFFNVDVFYGKVVVVEVTQGRSSYATAYRVDGRRAEIAKNFVFRALSDGNKIAFSVYQEGIKVLDTEQWTIKRYKADDLYLIEMSGNELFVANQNWKTGPSVQVIDISSGQSRYIRIPEWKSGIWGVSIESSARKHSLLMIDSSGVVYVIDKNNSDLIYEFNSGYPYTNTAMVFSEDGRLFATYGADGFIRVWAVVPAGADVR